MNIYAKKIKIFFVALAIVAIGFFAFGNILKVQAGTIASDFGLEQVGGQTGLGQTDIRATIASIIRVVLGVLGIVALVIVLYGGYTYMTAGGNEQKISTAKKILINGGIGLVIIMSAFAITQFVLTKLAEATGFGGGGVPSSCVELGGCSVENPQCCGGGTFGACTNLDNQFVVKSITPHTPSGATGMNNFAIRAIFSQGLDGAYNTVDQVFSVIDRDLLDVRSEFSLNFIDTERKVVELIPTGPIVDYLGDYDISVSSDLVSSGGIDLETDNICGGFPLDASFLIDVAVDDTEAPEVLDLIDDTDATTGDITYRGLGAGGRIALPQNNSYEIGANIIDDHGVAYVEMIVQRHQNSGVTIGAPHKIVYDGPRLSRGSEATLANPYNFINYLIIDGTYPLRTDPAFPDSYYTVTLNVHDIDHNVRTVTSEFDVVANSCSFPEGFGSAESCRGLGACTGDSDCLSGVCDEVAGMCLAVPIINEINPWNGAEGNWVTILGNFFGESPGRVFFDGIFANTPSCDGADVWHDNWIVVEVPGPAVPEGAGIVVRVDHDLYVTDPVANPDFFDTTGNDRGPIAGFTKDNTIVRPGLCSVISNAPGESYDGTNVGIEGTPVIASGQNLGDVTDTITFGGIQGAVDAWTNNQIDAVVPVNISSGWVGVIARVGTESSNGIPYRVMSQDELVAPLIESITPSAITRESYLTVRGQRFGDSVGVLYACADTDMSDLTDCLALNTTLPLACGVTWTNTQIIAEVPDTFPLSARYIVVENGLSGLQSVPTEADRLNVVAGAPLPSICALTPSAGSAPLADGHSGLNILGINFSNNPTVYFWGRGSDVGNNNTWLSLDGTTVPAGAELQSVVTQIPVDYFSHPFASLTPVAPDNNTGFSMQTGPIKLESNLGVESNSALYAVTDCRALSQIPTGMHCCSEGVAEGSLLHQSLACPGVPRDGGYVWRFTTGNIPEFRRVLEICEDSTLQFSPTPRREDDNGQNVCLNRQVSVEFTDTMNATSFAGNVSLYTCGNGSEPAGCAPIAEFSNDYDNANNVLTIRDVVDFGNLLPNTWYHIELGNGIEGFSQEMVLGVLTNFNTPIQRTRPCSADTAYCFDFKTGPVGTECILEDVTIRPIDYTVTRLGLVLDKRYPIESNIELIYQIFGKGNQACSLVSVEPYDWNWTTNLAAFGAVQSPILGADEKARAFALQEPPGNTVVIHATDMPVAQFGADSNLNIVLGDPQIIEFWPNCGEACANATIGARFNRAMDPSLYDTGIHIYRCGNSAENGENTCINAIADFDPDAPVAPALPEVNFNVVDDTNRMVAEIVPDTALPGDLLDPDTNYLIYFDASIFSVGEVDVLDNIISYGRPLEPKMWTFKTKSDGTFCIADRVDITPDPFVAYFVGQKTKYTSYPYTNADQCSPSGQKLNPWGFGWSWSTEDTDVAVVSNFVSSGVLKPFCGIGCLPKGSDIPNGVTSPFMCGNGIVDPGEDCDVSAPGEVAGDSCSIECLRPGNDNISCGNNIVETSLGEECDPGPTSDTRVGCSDRCTHLGSTTDPDLAVTGLPLCGSGSVTVGEDCEPGLNGEVLGVTCTNNCLHIGTNLVQEWCDDRPIWQETVECVQAISVCGNGELEKGEECEIIGGQFHLFDGNFGVAGADNGRIVAVPPAQFNSICSSKCLLQNICSQPTLTPFYCDPNTQEGCKPDCTLHGSSINNYTNPSLCGDGVLGAGEYGWCEYSPAELAAFSPPGQNPVQSVRAVGESTLDPGTQLQSTLVETNIVRIRGESADIPIAQQTQLSDQANYALACGFTEYVQPDLANLHNNCRDNGDNSLGVATNSCCYLRPERIDEYPNDGAGVLDANAVCLNSLVSVTFDGDINETSLFNNIIFAKGYTAELGEAEAPTGFVDEEWLNGLGINYPAPFTPTPGFFGSAYTYNNTAYLSGISASGQGIWGNSYTMSAWINAPFIDDGLRENVFNPDGSLYDAYRMRTIIGHLDNSFQGQKLGLYDGRLGYNINSKRDVVGGTNCALSTQRTSVVGDTIIADGQWHYVVAVVDQSTDMVRLFVDGVLYDEGSIAIFNSVPAICYPNRPTGVGGDSITGGQDFVGIIDEIKIDSTALSAEDIADNYQSIFGNYCLEQGLSDVTDLVNNTLAYGGINEVVPSSFWENIWYSIKQFFVWITGSKKTEASVTNVAELNFWCRQNLFNGVPQVSKMTDSAGNITESRVDLYLNDLLDQDSYYTVIFHGGKNGIKDVRGVGIRSPFNGVAGRQAEVDDSILFKTGAEVCKIADITVTPASYFYSAPNTSQNFTAIVESVNGQFIAPIPGVYDWEWFWTPSGDTIFSIVPDAVTTGGAPNRVISSTELEGQRTVGAHATVLMDTDITNSQVGETFTGTAELISMFCEKPWPPMEYFSMFEDEIGNNDGAPGGIFDGSVMEGTGPASDQYFNFKMNYCSDSGLTGNTLDDLPYLKPFVFNTVDGLPDSENLKRFLFFNDINDDVIGLQIFKTEDAPSILEKESLNQWFLRKIGSGTGFQKITIDGYEAMTNGSNYYISAINRTGVGQLYSNIFVFSINENAQQDTYKVFEQLINSLEFNSNLSDDLYCEGATDIACFTDFDCIDTLGNPLGDPAGTGSCLADKTKMKRDWTRLTTIRNAQIALNNYVESGNSAPPLLSGTYIPGKTRSTWPSWGNVGQAVGGGVGIDPINRWTSCNYCQTPGSPVDGVEQLCSTDDDCGVAGEICVAIDSQTCWDEINSRFICPAVSSVLEYRPDAVNDYQIFGTLEYFTLPDLTSFVETNHFQMGSMCGVAGSTESPLSGSCGNGIVNGTEQCDPPGQVISVPGGCVGGDLARVCSNSCTWINSGCDIETVCGNGRVNAGEECDDGALNGTPGNCSLGCTLSANYCGDSVRDSYCSFNNVNCTGNPNICLTSCGGNRNCEALNICSPVEFCDRGANNGDYLMPPGTFAFASNSCSSNCKQLGPRCGDGILHTGNVGEVCTANANCDSNSCSVSGVCNALEQCDDGNNTSGDGCSVSCQTEAPTATSPIPVSGSCGNSQINLGEVCDRGGSNGVQCTPGYNESCNYCSWDCKEVLYIEPNAYCGNEAIDTIAMVEYASSGNVGTACTVANQSTVCDSNYCISGECAPIGYCTADSDCVGSYCVNNFCSKKETCELIPLDCSSGTCTAPYILTNDGTVEIDQCSRQSGDYDLAKGLYTTFTGTYECKNSCKFLNDNCIPCGSTTITEGGARPNISVLNPMVLETGDVMWGITNNGLFTRFYFRDYDELVNEYILAENGSETVEYTPDHATIEKPERIFADNTKGLVSSAMCSEVYKVCFSPHSTNTGDDGEPLCLEEDLNSEFLVDYKVNNNIGNILNEYVVSPAVPQGTIRVVLRWTKPEADEFGGTKFSLGSLYYNGADTYNVRKLASPDQFCVEAQLNGSSYWEPNYDSTSPGYDCTVWPETIGGSPPFGREGIYMHEQADLKSSYANANTFIQSLTINTPDTTEDNSFLENAPYAIFAEAQSALSSAPMAYFDDSNVQVEIYEYKPTPAGGSPRNTIFTPTAVYSIKYAQKSSNPGAQYWHLFNIVRDVADSDNDGNVNEYLIVPVNRIVTGASQIQEGTTIPQILAYCGNGTLDDNEYVTETCDPAIPGQGNCLSTCDGYAVCGNNIVEANEGCDYDSATRTNNDCPYGQTNCLICGIGQCQYVNGNPNYCGDGDFDGRRCLDYGPGRGFECQGTGVACTSYADCGPEACDPSTNTYCNDTCTAEAPHCGDYIVQPGLGEECDPVCSGPSSLCNNPPYNGQCWPGCVFPPAPVGGGGFS